METGELSVPGTGGQRETRETQTQRSFLPRLHAAGCCVERASAWRVLCLSTELQGVSYGQVLAQLYQKGRREPNGSDEGEWAQGGQAGLVPKSQCLA